MPPFSRYNPLTKPKTAGAFKIPKGSVLKYIPGQGYTTAAAPVRQAAAQQTIAPARSPSQAPLAPFDYKKALLGEGIYQQDAANIQAANIRAQTDRDAAVKAAQFQFNDPSNPYSTLGEIGRDNNRAVAGLTANRAARGVLGSGGTILGKMDIGHDVGQNIFNATNQFNAGVGQQDAALADTLRQNRTALGQAVTDSQGRLLAGGVGLGAAGAPGGGSAPGGAFDPNRPGSFDMGNARATFQPNPSAQFANPFDYGAVKAGSFNPYTGKQILDPSVVGSTYNREFLRQSQSAQSNPQARKKALAFARRGY